eukprot:gene34134-39919_t
MLVVKRGYVWITQEGRSDDFWLHAGDAVIVAPGRLVVIEAALDSELSLDNGPKKGALEWLQSSALTLLRMEVADMELLWPLATFAFVTSITPGPNNIMLTSSGIWFGFLRSVPHMLGITCGFAVLLAICAAGIGSLVMALPVVHVLLKVMGSLYLLYLAWKLSSMGVGKTVDAA